MSKKLDKDKIQARVYTIRIDTQQIDAIEKEEAAGRMTIGMRQEKTNAFLFFSFYVVNYATQIDIQEITTE